MQNGIQWDLLCTSFSTIIQMSDAGAQMYFDVLKGHDEAKAVSESHVKRRWCSMILSMYGSYQPVCKSAGLWLWRGPLPGDNWANCHDAIPRETPRGGGLYTRHSVVPAQRATTDLPEPIGREVLYLCVILSYLFWEVYGVAALPAFFKLQ